MIPLGRKEYLAICEYSANVQRAHRAYDDDPMAASKADTLRDARLRLQARAISRDEYTAIRDEVNGWAEP